MNIGSRLKLAREAIGYTLEKVEDETGIGISSVSEFENEKREPKFSQLSLLAELYRKSIEFFLTDQPITAEVMLWRAKPNNAAESKETEVKFKQLCEQYRKLEILTGETKEVKLPTMEVKAEQFTYRDANLLAEKIHKEFGLGDLPSASLKQTLEEKYYVKIFHLSFQGSAISTVSAHSGPAILLNKDSKIWRRNFDLAHELFHILTWHIFRTQDETNVKPTEEEEQFANAFASRLLLPTDVVKNKIEFAVNENHEISFEALEEISREFGVSLDALMWRLLYLYNKPAEKIQEYIVHAKSMIDNVPKRQSDVPEELPERYWRLATRALRKGRLSLMRFAKYVSISYKDAQKYLVEDKDVADEKITIVAA
jgi:Zn-dependent peptidase ImmA (M78 family)/transcriptional regulator with XRE-family HTH domain